MKASSRFNGFDYRFELIAFVKAELKVGFDTATSLPYSASNSTYLSGPMVTSTGFLFTCFKCKTDHTELASQIKRWYEKESYGPTNRSTAVPPWTRGQLK